MDFADLPTYPLVVNPDFSPAMDAFSYPDPFDKAYLADAYSTQPDYTLDSFFDKPVSSIEFPSRLPSRDQQPMYNMGPTPASPADLWSNPKTPQFATFDPFQAGMPFEPINPAASRTPSLCGEPAQLGPPSTVPSFSPRNLKRESPSSPPQTADEPPAKRTLRTRGRRRLEREPSDMSSVSTTTSTSSYRPQATTATATNTTTGNTGTKSRSGNRLPHNQVERKYREGINSELDRLRRAVPTLPQNDESAAGPTQPKPSKAMILASAIDYIKKLEKERDSAVEECRRLRRQQRVDELSWEDEFTAA